MRLGLRLGSHFKIQGCLRLGFKFAFRFAFWVPLQNPRMLAVRLGLRLGSHFKLQGCLQLRFRFAVRAQILFGVAFRRLRFAFTVAFRVPLQNPRMLAFRAQVCV